MLGAHRALAAALPLAASRAAASMPPRKRKAAAAAPAAAPPPAPGAAATPSPKKRAKPVPPPRAHSEATLAKADRIAEVLAGLFPDPPCPLDHASPLQLLVAVMLSAQTTDIKVNECARTLFKVAPDAASLAALGAEGILPHIKALGLAPTKSKNVAATARFIVDLHGGAVPGDRASLEALPGVGRKTASVVLSMAGDGSAFPVDTHIHRLAARWGLSGGGSGGVEQTEADLCAAFPRARGHDWGVLHLRIIHMGRSHCPAKGHDAAACPVCSWAAEGV
jgi:endonuclease-3